MLAAHMLGQLPFVGVFYRHLGAMLAGAFIQVVAANLTQPLTLWVMQHAQRSLQEQAFSEVTAQIKVRDCLLYTSPSPRD